MTQWLVEKKKWGLSFIKKLLCDRHLKIHHSLYYNNSIRGYYHFHFIVEETEINLILPLPVPVNSRKGISGRVSNLPKVTWVADGKPDT